MTTRELTKFAKDYRSLLPPDWIQEKGKLMRTSGSWVQIVDIRSDRGFEPSYIIGQAFEFLKRPGELIPGFMANTLRCGRHPANTCSIPIREHSFRYVEVFELLKSQFLPRIDQAMDLKVIENELKIATKYLPHIYALCIISAEANRKEDAIQYYEQFVEVSKERVGSYLKTQLSELEHCIQLMEGSSAELHHYLKQIEIEQIQKLPLKLRESIIDG